MVIQSFFIFNEFFLVYLAWIKMIVFKIKDIRLEIKKDKVFAFANNKELISFISLQGLIKFNKKNF